MEKIKEQVDILKISKFVISNVYVLIEKNKTSDVKMVITNDLIHLKINNCIYTIANMMFYKKFIEKISYKYKIILPYIPKTKNDDIMNKIATYYYNTKFVTIILKENSIEIY